MMRCPRRVDITFIFDVWWPGNSSAGMSKAFECRVLGMATVTLDDQAADLQELKPRHVLSPSTHRATLVWLSGHAWRRVSSNTWGLFPCCPVGGPCACSPVSRTAIPAPRTAVLLW